MLKELANEMTVSTNDITNFAKSIIECMKKDGANNIFMKLPIDQQVEMVLAYSSHVIKQSQEFQTLLMTNSNFKKNFDNLVYELEGLRNVERINKCSKRINERW